MPPVVRASRNYQAALRRSIDDGGLWQRRDVEPFEPNSVAVGESIPAFVNSGRWIVQCPNCGSGQLVDPQQDRFLCVECVNDHLGRQWVTVVWPAELDAIEEVLSVRDELSSMNWRPGETVEELQAENEANGTT